jgi:hypothetical protein
MAACCGQAILWMAVASWSMNCQGRMLSAKLTELTNYADIVIDAKIVNLEISKTVSPFFGRAAILRFRIIETIRVNGDQPDRDIDVLWFPSSGDYGNPHIGDRGVIFLAKCGQYYEPQFGFESFEPIVSNDRVETSNISSERPIQSLKAFKRRIRRIISLPTMRAVPDSFRCASKGDQ